VQQEDIENKKPKANGSKVRSKSRSKEAHVKTALKKVAT